MGHTIQGLWDPGIEFDTPQQWKCKISLSLRGKFVFTIELSAIMKRHLPAGVLWNSSGDFLENSVSISKICSFNRKWLLHWFFLGKSFYSSRRTIQLNTTYCLPMITISLIHKSAHSSMIKSTEVEEPSFMVLDLIEMVEMYSVLIDTMISAH